ncbi:TMEM43 family protein [Rhizobium sp. ARZ01]|uniref:TMEM43 family protein n=1 Tax=Rhizobium sp. ARZ01 TaxID=2769313 RepID=UPI001781E97F|nr:TMEM43 family protein [Rhizobium sp. ARZ01]MBD9374249.1 TMEM43 family protein [Rhizobium sp. ARZ01]
MSFTETTTTSWFARVKNALVMILIGLALVCGCIWLLAWNEGRSVATYRALVEGAGLVSSVDSASVDPANEGKLVHISGAIRPDGVPVDDELGVAAEGAFAVRRAVEMYQWVQQEKSETKKQLGGSEETVTTYSYAKEWRSDAVDSSNFRQAGHDNPEMPIEGALSTVDSASLGAFRIDGDRVAALGQSKAIELTADEAAQVSEAIGLDGSAAVRNGWAIFSDDPQKPAIADLRVRFERVDLDQASFVGAQRGQEIVGYRASNGRTLFLSEAGTVDAARMFDAAQSENTLITWLIRIGGLVGIFVGFAMMLSILGVIADVVPFIGSIVRFGTGAVALVLTMLIGPLVIAVAWIAYRPLVAIGVLAAGALLAAGIVYLRRGRQALPAAA